MAAIFNLEIVFEHPVWRVLTELKIPYKTFIIEKEQTVHILVEDKHTEKVANALRNLRITI